MNHDEAETFVRSFEAAWAVRDGDAMRRLWHPDGLLFTPVVDRPISPHELPKLVAAQIRIAPDLAWHLLDWAMRGSLVYVEWRVTQTIGGTPTEWRGMDRFLLEDGRIREEHVFADTTPMRLMAAPDADRNRLAAASKSSVSPTPMIRL
jgi:hypothetical protein